MRKSCVWGDGMNREFQSIPEEMKGYPHWLVWKLINKGGEKPSKVPFSVHGGAAAVNDSATWGTFKEAAAAYEAGQYDGIGFVFTGTPFVGIDIDSCINQETGEVSPEAADIIKATQSYTELSQSRKGLHIIMRGKLQAGRRRNGPFEMYGDGSPRYFAMTGNLWGEPTGLEANQAAIDAVHKKYIAKQEKPAEGSPLEDEQIIDKASSAKNGGAFLALYNGDWQGKYKSQSEADMAFCNLLAFWTGCNADQMDRIFRRSGLMRPKWDEQHGSRTYGEITVQRAINDSQNFKTKGKATVENLSCDLISLDQVEETEAEWLIPEYIPKGQITLLGGDGGSGKTSIWCQIVASISSGKPCFMTEDTLFTNIEHREPQKVLFFSAEDSMQHVLKKRLRMNGAIMENIFSLDPSDDRFERIKFDDPFLEELIKEHRPALVVFDPLQSFIPWHADLSKRNQVRQCLTYLMKYGEKYGCTFLIIVHTNKQSNVWGRKRIADTADLWDAARSVLIAGETGEDNIRYISHEKCNYGPTGETVLFSLGRDGLIKFGGYSSKKDRDYVSSLWIGKKAGKKEDAKEFILEHLESGKKEVHALTALARAAGHSATAIKRTKQELKEEEKIKIFSTGFGKEKRFYAEKL